MNTPENASVHSLELRKQPHEVYESFYNLYGGPEFIDQDGSMSRSLLLDGRVLHDDKEGNRDMHLIIRERSGVPLPPSRRQGYGDTIQHVFPYLPETFIVATTDGTNIERWQVVGAMGIHHGIIDTIWNPYRSENEMVNLRLVNDAGNAAHLNFNKGAGYGTAHFSDRGTRWIMDTAVSQAERARVLVAAPIVGTIATAS